MNKTEQLYLDKLEPQARVGLGLLRLENAANGWTKKHYRARLDKINEECVELDRQVNTSGGRLL